ncbi:unnamed protein product, partial [Closterium sp. NIES-53]
AQQGAGGAGGGGGGAVGAQRGGQDRCEARRAEHQQRAHGGGAQEADRRGAVGARQVLHLAVPRQGLSPRRARRHARSTATPRKAECGRGGEGAPARPALAAAALALQPRTRRGGRMGRYGQRSVPTSVGIVACCSCFSRHLCVI